MSDPINQQKKEMKIEGDSMMTGDLSTMEPVRRTVDVNCSTEEAFRIFTEGIDDWWPLATHSKSQGDADACFFEGRVGGRIYETGSDGTVCLWGTVTEWLPPQRDIFTWHPGRESETAQEVELRFIDLDPGTRVELEHSGWDALGDAALEVRDGYHSGWDFVLSKYVVQCSK